jgi:YjbE family integral membrane protein
MHPHLTLFDPGGFSALLQVLMIDIVLAGDNAVVIGLAAARVPAEMRKKVIFWGLAAAVGLRIVMAGVAVTLLQIIGLMLAGGILLLWVSWRFWRDIRGSHQKEHLTALNADASLKRAIVQILLADVSMSLDNVLAVAGAARNHLDVMVMGLLLSVALMGAAASLIARLLERYRWISYLGLLVVVYVALNMIYHGSEDVLVAMPQLHFW